MAPETKKTSINGTKWIWNDLSFQFFRRESMAGTAERINNIKCFFSAVKLTFIEYAGISSIQGFQYLVDPRGNFWSKSVVGLPSLIDRYLTILLPFSVDSFGLQFAVRAFCTQQLSWSSSGNDTLAIQRGFRSSQIMLSFPDSYSRPSHSVTSIKSAKYVPRFWQRKCK